MTTNGGADRHDRHVASPPDRGLRRARATRPSRRRSPPRDPRAATRRRRRARAAPLRPRTAAGRARGSTARSGRAGPPGPTRPGAIGAPAVRTIRFPTRSSRAPSGRRGRRTADPGRCRRRASCRYASICAYPCATRCEQPERVAARQRVGKEETEQRLVAQLDPRLRAGEPRPQLSAPGRGDRVDAARAAAARPVASLDPAGGFEPLQLRIDLTVARRPEVADRPVDRCFDVVAAAWPT